MNAALLSAALFLASSSPPTTSSSAAQKLWGTWRLVSFTRTLVESGEKTDVFGKQPHGYITYGKDGRMMVLIVKSERHKPEDMAKVTDEQRAELFKGMIAYGGT